MYLSESLLNASIVSISTTTFGLRCSEHATDQFPAWVSSTFSVNREMKYYPTDPKNNHLLFAKQMHIDIKCKNILCLAVIVWECSSHRSEGITQDWCCRSQGIIWGRAGWLTWTDFPLNQYHQSKSFCNLSPGALLCSDHLQHLPLNIA